MQRCFVFRPRPQRVLCTKQETIAPLLNFSYFQPVLARGFNCRRLSFEEANHQCCPTLRRPALHFIGPWLFCHLPPRLVSLTLYYWWLYFPGEQDTRSLSKLLLSKRT